MVIFEMLEMDFLLIYFLLQRPYEILATAGQVRSGRRGRAGYVPIMPHISRDKARNKQGQAGTSRDKQRRAGTTNE